MDTYMLISISAWLVCVCVWWWRSVAYLLLGKIHVSGATFWSVYVMGGCRHVSVCEDKLIFRAKLTFHGIF